TTSSCTRCSTSPSMRTETRPSRSTISAKSASSPIPPGLAENGEPPSGGSPIRRDPQRDQNRAARDKNLNEVHSETSSKRGDRCSRLPRRQTEHASVELVGQ